MAGYLQKKWRIVLIHEVNLYNARYQAKEI
jgi:hypothetical protein